MEAIWNRCEEVLSQKSFDREEIVLACTEILGESRRLSPSGRDEDKAGFTKFLNIDDYFSLSMALICIGGAALAAGLTVSTVSLRAIDLRVKCRTGTPSEQRSAEVLLPLVSMVPRHRLLVTLLLCNSVFNEALPTFLDDLVPTWAAILLSVRVIFLTFLTSSFLIHVLDDRKWLQFPISHLTF